MPVPISGESRTDFISRCVPIVIEDGTAEDGDQAIAICISMWDNRKGGNMEHEYKTFDFTVKDFDYEGRTVEGYASVFNVRDLGGDIVHFGAFTKTLIERGNKVRFLWQHDIHEPIGKPLEIREDERGLFFKAIISDTSRGRDSLSLLRDQAITGLSIGYDSIKGGTDYSKTADGETVRNLRELRLWEVSLVSMPMCEEAEILSLKTKNPDDKSINLTARVDSVRNAFREQFNPPDTGPVASDSLYYWVNTVYDDHLIVEAESAGEFYSVGYTIDADGNIVFAPKTEWTPGEYTFIAIIKSVDAALERK